MDEATKQAERTIAVLSPDYPTSEITPSEWGAAFRQDPTGSNRKLVPVRVRRCELKGLLGAIVYIDLVDLPETAAKAALLDGVAEGRAKPATAPAFPGGPQRSTADPPAFPGGLPLIWNVPHLRNPNFTGREGLLDDLRRSLTSGQAAAVTQAIAGLGGVGKTQLATEYAYRYTSEYDLVWWVRSEEAATLGADYAALAGELGLPEREATDPERRRPSRAAMVGGESALAAGPGQRARTGRGPRLRAQGCFRARHHNLSPSDLGRRRQPAESRSLRARRSDHVPAGPHLRDRRGRGRRAGR